MTPAFKDNFAQSAYPAYPADNAYNDICHIKYGNMSLYAYAELRYHKISLWIISQSVVLMTEMLTAKEMQDLLQVDRSTIYRMAEAGQLPAVKVGKQWRFPGDLVEGWLKNQTGPATSSATEDLRSLSNIGSLPTANGDFAAMLPLDCVQLIQDAFAEALDVMLVVTDLDGQPITQVSNPCRLYELLAETENGHAICQETWRELAQVPALEPRFTPGFGGLLCARALVRMGNQLKGTVIVFGVAPADWPPSTGAIADLATSLEIPAEELGAAFNSVFCLTLENKKTVLVTMQRIADILAHIGDERMALLGRLSDIARLSAV
jgi:excisionase family DNA binding protein